MLRSTALAVLASGLFLNLQADSFSTLTFTYTFTLPTFDSSGNPNGGNFVTVLTSSPGPLINTVVPEEENPFGFVPPVLSWVDSSQSPKPGFTAGFASNSNLDAGHEYNVLGENVFVESSGVLVELDYGNSLGGHIDFDLGATDSFWSGRGGAFDIVAEYLTSGDPPCTTCRVDITPEPTAIVLLATVAAGLWPIAFRRRKRYFGPPPPM